MQHSSENFCELFLISIGQKKSYPQNFEIQLVSQPFQCFKSSLFFKIDNLFFDRS